MRHLQFFIFLVSVAVSLVTYAESARQRNYVKPSTTAPVVAQAEYLITNNRSHPLVQTLGVGPCVAVTLWDPVTRTGILAHFDAETEADEEMQHLIDIMKARGVPASRLQARLVGAWKLENNPASMETLTDIETVLKKASITVKSRDVATPYGLNLNDPFGSLPPADLEESEIYKHLQFDLNTGNLNYLRDSESQGVSRRSVVRTQRLRLNESPLGFSSTGATAVTPTKSIKNKKAR